MNVVGLSRTRFSSPSVPMANNPWNLVFATRSKSPSSTQPSFSARRSTTSNPTLCRVATYSRPGLPSPTTSFIPLLLFRFRRGSAFRRRFLDLASDDFRLGRAFLNHGRRRDHLFLNLLHRRNDQIAVLEHANALRQLDVAD